MRLDVAETAESFDPTPKRDPTKDPQYGDAVRHLDGCMMYVFRRLPRMVCVSRRPNMFGHVWMRLSTFQKLCRGDVG